MRFSILMKQLKKYLQQNKKWKSLALIFVAAGLSVTATVYYLNKESAGKEEAALSVWYSQEDSELKSEETELNLKNQELIETIKKEALAVEVFYKKQYVCGEEIKQIGQMFPNDIEQLYTKDPSVTLTMEDNSILYFTEKIADLSEQCKENAYFGIDKNTNLSLFEGIPSQDQIIRTFFQLNVHHLKSSLPMDTLNQLYTGIRILDIEDYYSVISTFSDYAISGEKRQ